MKFQIVFESRFGIDVIGLECNHFSMPKVLADKEEVVFQEGIPTDPGQIYQLLMAAFAEQKRSVVKYLVDGKDTLQTGEFPEAFDIIEAESLSHDEISLRLSIDFINQMNTLETSISAYLINVLTTSWSDVFNQMDAFIKKIQPFADLIDHISPYVQSYEPPWKNEIEEIAKSQAECLGQILLAFENSDPAGLSEELEFSFLPLYATTINLFSQKIIPFLKEATDQQTDQEVASA
ncbi:MAG: hypothetical protein VW576_06465 [Opitutae bacterium]